MSIVRIIVLILLVGILTAVTIPALQTRIQHNQVGDPTKIRVIPLKEIYTNFDQPGAKVIDFQKLDLEGASNLCVIHGDDLTEIKAWAHALFPGSLHGTLVPSNPPEGNRPAWLVVYFGTDGSFPAPWLVHFAEVADRRIKVFFSARSLQTRGTDVWHHFAFVPLGRLQPGRYSLELIHKNSDQPELIRFIEIGTGLE